MPPHVLLVPRPLGFIAQNSSQASALGVTSSWALYMLPGSDKIGGSLKVMLGQDLGLQVARK
jgi:hypothetical protein